MYLSTSDAIAAIIALGSLLFMLVMLFLANNSLLIKNRYLKETIKNKNKYCALNHKEVQFK